MLSQATVQRHSKELLNLRKIQNTLAKNKRYEEAAKMKAKADELVSHKSKMPCCLCKFNQVFIIADVMGRRKVAQRTTSPDVSKRDEV